MTRLSRRGFLAGIAAVATLPPSARAQAAAPSFGPASFDVTATSALVWLRTTGRASVRVEYGPHADLGGAMVTAPATATEATDYTVVTELTGLTPGTQYFYRGLVAGGAGDPVKGAIGRFRTAPAMAHEFRFAWSGDMHAGHRPYAILDHVTALRPDFFLMVGDTMYADFPKKDFVASLAHYRMKHRENREDAPLQRMLAAMPVAAIWDDHEVENDFDRTHPALAEGAQAFREYWPVRSGPLYRRFTWTPVVEVFVLDCRSFRSPHAEPDGPAKTMLGAAQKAWLKDGLAGSKATFKFVVSSVPFLTATRTDAWSGYQTEHIEIVKFIRAERIRNIVVLSADHHMALDLEEDGIQEYVAGPIGAWPLCRNRRLIQQALEQTGRFFICDRMNVGLITVRPHTVPPQIETQFVDARGAILHGKVTTAS